MKRSEAANQIMAFLQGRRIDWGTYGYDILDAVEAIGMLPPTARLNATNEFMSAKELLRESGYDVDSAWEDEDESN